MNAPVDVHGTKRKRKRKRRMLARRTAIWSLDGTTLLAAIEGPVTPDDVEAARLLALRATQRTT
ncbi:hypothetical protein AB0L65_20800 [Nonomuraea sp. NPDC052116]|uniref:hypothetical protein n=1 Tax=Nonomuraea sp. NPDC052116 TaxID=3155665 RepID=UPI00343817E6